MSKQPPPAKKGKVTITLPNLFSGRLLAGKTPEQFESMTEAERLSAQLGFIRERAEFLAHIPYDPSHGYPANVQSQAVKLSRAAQDALAHLSNADTPKAAMAAMQVGEGVAGIDAILARAKALDVTEQVFSSKSAGGQATAEVKKADAEKNIERAVQIWEELAQCNRPERERAAVIAARMGAKAGTVRGWLKKARSR